MLVALLLVIRASKGGNRDTDQQRGDGNDGDEDCHVDDARRAPGGVGCQALAFTICTASSMGSRFRILSQSRIFVRRAGSARCLASASLLSCFVSIGRAHGGTPV